jgi:hypothetical protein
MEFENFIGRKRNVLNVNQCEALIDAMYDENNESCVVSDHVRADVNIFLDKGTPLFDNLKDILYDQLKSYNRHFCIPDVKQYEINHIKVQESQTGGGFTEWHYEWAPGPYGRREIVWMIYLNDDYEHGETEFKHLNHAEKPEAGKLLFFPAGFTHLHRANPNLIGTKYITTSWFEAC